MFKVDGFVMPLSFNTNKVLYVAEALGQPYECNQLDFSKEDHKSADYVKKMHPFGKAPALTHDNKTMFESGAICRYMASVAESPLYPTNDHYKRTQVDQWMDFFTSHMGRWSQTALFENVFKKEFGMGEADPQKVEEATNFFNGQCESLNNYLEDKKFLCGNEMTIADIFAFAYLETTPASGLKMENHKNVWSWFQAMKDQPFVANVHKKFNYNA